MYFFSTNQMVLWKNVFFIFFDITINRKTPTSYSEGGAFLFVISEY